MVHGGSPGVAGRHRPDLIVDDGGDATLFVHKARSSRRRASYRPSTPANDPEEWGVILDTARTELKAHPGRWTKSPKASRASAKRRRPASTASTR